MDRTRSFSADFSIRMGRLSSSSVFRSTALISKIEVSIRVRERQGMNRPASRSMAIPLLFTGRTAEPSRAAEAS